LQEKLQNRVSIIGVIVFVLDAALVRELIAWVRLLGMDAPPASGGFRDLVLLCETAGCKMEQKKNTIILDE
jgi:hypothetical protein